jgi:hypothetical protein
MNKLSLVKSLAHLREEQKLSEEVLLESVGLLLTRGSVTEIVGKATSGRTSIVLNLISKLTRAGEVCAVVDSANSFDPRSAVLAGVCLENLLWVRCDGELENAFTAADYLVQAKGFGLIWLNLVGLSRSKLRMVPRTYWYRYRNRIKETPTLFVVTAEDPVAGSASQQSFALERKGTMWSGRGRFKLLRELDVDWRSRKHSFGPPVRTKVEFYYSDV